MVLMLNHRSGWLKLGVAALLVMLTVVANAQKLKRSELDKNTSQWRMETFATVLKSGADAKLSVAIQAADTTITLHLSGSGKGTNTVDEGSRLELLLENDSTVVAYSPTMQSLEYGQTLATYSHQYRTPLAVLEQLASHNLRAMRKYSIGGYDDIFVDRKAAANLRQSAAFFLSEWRGKQPTITLVAPPAVGLAPARFPGGDAAFFKFINRNLQPLQTVFLTEKKTVVMELTLSTDGTVTGINVQQSAGTPIDEELLRILRRMPKWRPAMQDGKMVESTVAKTINIERIGSGALQADR